MAKAKFKDAKRTNFVVGDKVRILPSAVAGGVRQDEVGTTQTVIRIIDSTTGLVDITGVRNISWWVYSNQIEPAIKIGQQLVFSFME